MTFVIYGRKKFYNIGPSSWICNHGTIIVVIAASVRQGNTTVAAGKQNTAMSQTGATTAVLLTTARIPLTQHEMAF
jgi:hypothetical protein